MKSMALRPVIGTLACLLAATAMAQQLVPNPSFETVTTCPTFASQLGHAAPWFNPTQGTPELYHACAGSGSYAGVPANSSGGFQMPRTGQGFAGLYTYKLGYPNVREYIAVPLLQPLQAGTCYQFRMYVNMPDDFELACDAIGVHFSTGPLIVQTVYLLPVTPQIEHPIGQLITDTVGWTEVNGVYTAVGGEDHLTIGNFRTDVQTTIQLVNPGVWYQGQAYLLVDDVSLEPIPDDLDLGPDTAFCTGGSVVLDASVPGATSVLWNDGSTAAVRTVSTAGTFSVAVNLGGCFLHDTVVVRVVPEPFLDLGPDLLLCPGQRLLILPDMDSASVLTWQDGAPVIGRMVEWPGRYAATATNACGTASDAVDVFADSCPDIIYMPNAFTPDGNGHNDRFAPVYDRRVWSVSFTVYDRWGMTVFTAQEGVEWDGAGAPPGPYTVLVEARSLAEPNHARQLAGHVMLLR
ncbi:MAG: gliding motility-associated C-terminal domain-containing protein [Flavobacteriales bacterium]|nr:gliding motility-associated C-terminal domain-containing protein [Flavobacteriales bacterium]